VSPCRCEPLRAGCCGGGGGGGVGCFVEVNLSSQSRVLLVTRGGPYTLCNEHGNDSLLAESLSLIPLSRFSGTFNATPVNFLIA